MNSKKLLFLFHKKETPPSSLEKRHIFFDNKSGIEAAESTETPKAKMKSNVEKFEEKLQNPQKIIENIKPFELDLSKIPQAEGIDLGLLQAALNILIFQKNVGEIISGNDPQIQRIAGVELSQSFLDKIDGEFIKKIITKEIVNLKFEAKTSENNAVINCELFDKNGNIVGTFEFPFTSTIIEKLRGKKETVQLQSIEQRQQNSTNGIIEASKEAKKTTEQEIKNVSPADIAGTKSAQAEAPASTPESIAKREDTIELQNLSVTERLILRKKTIDETLNQVQSIIDQTAENIRNKETEKALGQNTKRTIEISKEEIPGKTYRPILIDGKMTTYVIDIATKPAKSNYEVRFSIKQQGEKTAYQTFEEWNQDPSQGEILVNIISSIPNRNPLENREKAIAALKEAGITINEKTIDALSPFTIEKYQTLMRVATELDNAYKAAPDAYAILKTYRKASLELFPLFDTNKVEINYQPPLSNVVFTWKDWSEVKDMTTNTGFGLESEIIKKILKVVQEQFGENSEPYKIFEELSRTRQTTEEKEKRKLFRSSEKYALNYQKLTEQDFKLDEKIGELDQEEMEKYWTQFNGHRKVENIMTKYPFGLSQNRVRNVATQIICGENFFDKNSLVDFEDIFDYMKGFPLINKKEIPAEYLKDGGDFLEEFNRLMNKGNISPSEEKLRAKMYTDIVVPCLDLLSAIQEMKAPKKGIKEETISYKESIDSGLAPGQTRITDAVNKLFSFTEDPSDAWERFLNWAGGGEETIPMSRVDGSTFAVDEGMFRRNFSPHSAILALFNTPGLYTLDQNGKKILNETRVIQELDKFIRRGFMQLALQEKISQKGEARASKLNKEEFKIQKLENVYRLNKTQLLAFQLGFVNAKITQFEQKIESVSQILADSPPALRSILEQIKDKVPLRQLAKIKSTLLGVAGLQFHDSGKGYEAVGAGIGTGIALDDGYTLLLNAGAKFTGEPAVFAGVGLDIQVFKSNETVVSIAPQISVLGAGASIQGIHGIAKGWELGWGFGLALSWSSMNSGLGAGITISWEDALIEARKESLTEDAKEKSGLKELWGRWESLPRSQKWPLVKALPAYADIDKSMKENPEILTENVVINMIDSYINQVSKEEIYEKMNAIPFVPVGFGFGGALSTAALASGPAWAAIALIGGLKFQIGSVTVFIPHPREESRILSEISNAAIESRIREIFAKMKTGEIQVAFTERTPDIYYKPGSELGKGILVERQNIDLSGLTTGIESYNEALKPAEIKLSKIISNNKVKYELITDNDDDKDVEIHIDPLLAMDNDQSSNKLGGIYDSKSGHFYLSGNIDDLIITRERFEFPKEVADENASIRDVITIRKKRSLTGKRDRLWIEDHEAFFLEKLVGEKKYRLTEGANVEDGIQNLYNVPGYDNEAASASAYTMEKIKELEKIQTSFEGELDKVTIQKMETEIGRMRKALNEKVKTEYENEKSMPQGELESTLSKLYKDTKFKKEFTKSGIIDNPDRIISLIKKYSTKENHKELQNLTEAEYNTAITYLLNQWFITVYKGSGEKEYSRNRLNSINSVLLTRIERVKKWTKKKYYREFENLKKEGVLRKEASPKQMIDKLVNDVYGDLETKLKNKTNPIDFGKDITVGDGLKAGEIFVSGTRARQSTGGQIRAFGSTINYRETEKREGKAHEYGFLEGKDMTIGLNYDPSREGVEGDLAKALLEIASPIPKTDTELIKSPLAMKLLGLSAYRLMVEEENGGGPIQYKEIMEILNNPTPEFIKERQESMNRFRKFVERVRESQLNGRPLEITTSQGLTIILNMSETKIRSGAYSKCGNISHSVNELGSITIMKPRKTATGLLDVTNEVVDVELTKKFVSFGLAAGFSSSPVKPKIVGKRPEKGPSELPREGKQPELGPVKVETAAGTDTVETGPGSLGGSPKSQQGLR